MSLMAYILEHNRYMNFFGIIAIIVIAWLFSYNRSRVNYWLILKALGLQFGIGFLVLKTNPGHYCVSVMAQGVAYMYQFADEGSRFVFGNLVNAETPWGFIFAIRVLPVIIFFGAFTAVMFHFGIIQKCVAVINALIRPLLGTSGAETLCAVSNSFLGQTEAPLLIRNYLKTMTKSEILVVMVSGMATISGSILVVFGSMGVPVEHMLAASVMAIPASIMIAKIIIPETEQSQTAVGADVKFENDSSNVMDAVFRGTSDGLSLAVNVAAMLIAFMAFLAFFDAMLAGFAFYANMLFIKLGLTIELPVNLSVKYIFGLLFKPFGYLLGFTSLEASVAGELIGIKVAANELIAYGELITRGLSERTMAILTYALCGFSNFSCIGIQVGGIGALVPEKRQWLTELGWYAVLGGALSNILSAMMASLLL